MTKSMKFTEAKLEQAFIDLLNKEGYSYLSGEDIKRDSDEVLLKDDLREFLSKQYTSKSITIEEIEKIIRQLESYSELDLYSSNKAIMKMISDGFVVKREDRNKKDLFIHLIDYFESDNNIYKIVNQLEIIGNEKRIPDGIIYINGLPLVVIEFKTAIRENTTTHDAYVQLTTRYKRDIPRLFKYNAFCVISDGVNNKAGSFFAPYEFFYAWRRIDGNEDDVDGISSLYTLAQGMFNKYRLRDIVHNLTRPL